jgi:hypothetical protein
MVEKNIVAAKNGEEKYESERRWQENTHMEVFKAF